MQSQWNFLPAGTPAILRLEEVAQLLGISRTSIWRYEREGKFPLKLPLLDSAIGWAAKDIDGWIAQLRETARDAGQELPRPPAE